MFILANRFLFLILVSFSLVRNYSGKTGDILRHLSGYEFVEPTTVSGYRFLSCTIQDNRWSSGKTQHCRSWMDGQFSILSYQLVILNDERWAGPFLKLTLENIFLLKELQSSFFFFLFFLLHHAAWHII